MKIPRSLKFTGSDPGIIGYEKQKLINALKEKLKEDGVARKIDNSMMGRVPNILVGSYNYPTVNTGFLATDEVKVADNPKEWVQDKSIGIKDIILMRQTLANSRFVNDVKTRSRFSDKLKEISLSSKALDAEIHFDGHLSKDFSLNIDTLPHGPVAALRSLDVLENAKIPFHVQRAESDIDLKANDAIKILNTKGIDEHFLTRIVSAGNLGVKVQRKIVPTKWSITMVDDSLGKEYIRQIRGNEPIEHCFFEGSYLGNYYFVLIFPGPWSFELFETYVGDLTNASEYASASDSEGPFGRTKYADNTSGGYYASRIASLEYLIKHKKIGRVLMFRFITEEYWAPLGVWVVREASRNAMQSKSITFENRESLIKHVFTTAIKQFKINIQPMIRRSKIIKDITEQKTLY